MKETEVGEEKDCNQKNLWALRGHEQKEKMGGLMIEDEWNLKRMW